MSKQALLVIDFCITAYPEITKDITKVTGVNKVGGIVFDDEDEQSVEQMKIICRAIIELSRLNKK